MSTHKVPENARASEMTYTVTSMPNSRNQRIHLAMHADTMPKDELSERAAELQIPLPRSASKADIVGAVRASVAQTTPNATEV